MRRTYPSASKGGSARGGRKKRDEVDDANDTDVSLKGTLSPVQKQCCSGDALAACWLHAPGYQPGTHLECDDVAGQWKQGCDESIEIYLKGIRDPSGFVRNATLGTVGYADVRYDRTQKLVRPASYVFSPEEAVRVCEGSLHILGVILENKVDENGNYACYFIPDFPPLPLDFRFPTQTVDTWAYLKGMADDPPKLPHCMTHICSLDKTGKWGGPYAFCKDIATRQCSYDPHKPWCREFCASDVRQCDAMLETRCKTLPLRKALADDMCGCHLPQPYVSSYYARLRKQYRIPIPNENIECGMAKCASSRFKREKPKDCPDIAICASIVDITNHGTIDNLDIEQAQNCTICMQTGDKTAEECAKSHRHSRAVVLPKVLPLPNDDRNEHNCDGYESLHHYHREREGSMRYLAGLFVVSCIGLFLLLVCG